VRNIYKRCLGGPIYQLQGADTSKNTFSEL
jgi:hypothetical protein